MTNDRLTFVTYNVGLLRLRLCGCATVFSNPPFVAERLPHIPAALRRYPADVLALQECYEETHFDLIREELQDLYPHTARVQSGDCCLKFHNGLAVFSKHPIRHVALQPYDKVATLERWMATKSSLIVDVDIHGQLWRFVNVHTTAGGTVDPENPATDLDRQDELRQAVEAAGSGGVVIGDLNCGPEASPANFEYILNRGYRDTFAEHQGHRLDVTWDPQNVLNASGPHKDCPGQRCDHVLLPCEATQHWKVTRTEIILDEAVVGLKDGTRSTLSDHYGLLVEIMATTTEQNTAT